MSEKITVITHWYNEELLAPLFFKHYEYVDEIRILLETETDDNTRKLIEKQANIVVEDVHNNGCDEVEMEANYRKAVSQVKEGWIYVADADEFIFPEHFEDPQVFLARQTAQIVNVKLFNVYRHKNEVDIDYEKEPISQRIHGSENGPQFRHWMIKPTVFRASANVIINKGRHTVTGEYTFAEEKYLGAHWKMADLEIAMRRRLSNHKRMSAYNARRGYWGHELNITKEKIEMKYLENLNMPVLDCLVRKKI